MKHLIKIFRGAVFVIMIIPRKLYYLLLRKKLTNKAPTIIASDCVGGIMYHNLGLKFMSPTINLFFDSDDFNVFVRHLKDFLEAELTEVEVSDVDYPIGQLEYNGEKVRINFMHYDDFKSAKIKWDGRKKRVDFNNIYIVQLIQRVTLDDINKFESLPYKNKILITNKNITDSPNIYEHPIFDKEDYFPGKILDYKSRISVKRYMDDINYVDFLNEKIAFERFE